MKEGFPDHYRPTDEDFERLWAEGVFVFDANVLLNLYRYDEGTRADFFKVIEALAGRIWVPHQAEMEYERNRLTVIVAQQKQFADVRKAVHSRRFEEDLARYSDSKRIPFKVDDFLAAVKTAVSEFDVYLSGIEAKQIRVESEDPVRIQLDLVFKGKTGAPYSQAELDTIYAEGADRYERKTPPGYADLKKKGNDEYEEDGRRYKREFGDLVLWKQILDRARSENIKDLVLVTDDRTEDWLYIVESNGPKIIGPRPELRAEIRNVSGVQLFHMYQLERFLKFGESQHVPVQEASVVQVQAVSEVDSMRDAAISFVSGSEWNFDRRAVIFWALVNGKNVPCLIAEESLQDHFGADPAGGSAEMKAAFERNRRTIEVMARDAIRSGRINARGEVLITSDDVEVGLVRKSLDDLKRYSVILAGQARELAGKLRQDAGAVTAKSTDDIATVLREVSDAHELLADIRSRVPGEIDPVLWERTRVEDGRDGEEIFERLGDVIRDLVRAKRKLEG